MSAIMARLGLDAGDFRKGLEQVRKDLVKVKAEADQSRSKSITAAAAKAESDFADKQKKSADALRERAAAEKRAAEIRKQAMANQRAILAGSISEFAGIAGVSLSVGGAVAAGKAILDFAGNLADSSEALGINVEALQELEGAFGQSGASAEVINKGLAKLSENLTAARNGDEKLIASFAGLGVSWRDLQTLAPDQIIMKIAESASEAHDPAERLSLIIDVMGKAGLKMAAGLNGGVEALQKMRQESSKLSKEDIAALDEAGDALTRLQTKAKVLAAREVARVAGSSLLKNAASAMFPALGGMMREADRQKPPDFAPGYRPVDPLAAEQPAEKFVPLPPAQRAAIEQQAKAAMDLIRQETQNANKLADMQADQAQERADAAKKAAEAQAELQRKEDAECHEAEMEHIAKERDARREAAEQDLSKRRANIAELARESKEKLDQAVSDIRNPGSRSARRREEREQEQATKRAIREEDLKARGGKAAADVKRSNVFGPSMKELGGDKTSMGAQLDASQMAQDIKIIRENLKAAEV